MLNRVIRAAYFVVRGLLPSRAGGTPPILDRCLIGLPSLRAVRKALRLYLWKGRSALAIIKILRCLAVTIALQTLFRFLVRLLISGSIIFFRGLLIPPDGLGRFPKAEWNLTSSLPLRPVLKYGVDVAPAKVIVLLESYLLRQMLPLDVFALGSLQFSPGDSPLSAADSGL